MSENRSAFRKSIKGPDLFQTRVMKAADWLRQNPAIVAGLAIPIIVLVIGGIGYSLWQTSQQDKRIEKLGEIHVVYESEGREIESAREGMLDQLDGVRAELATARETGATARISELEQQESSLTTKIRQLKADRSESAALYRQFFDEHRSQAEGWAAAMMVVTIDLENENLSEARDLLQEILKASTSSPFYQTHARLTLIGVLEDLGQFDNAIAESDKLLSNAADDVKPQVLLAKGRALLLAGDHEAARGVFDQMEQDFSERPETQQARSLRNLIRG